MPNGINGISKRQQQRNEKALTELIRTVPGNDRCADCDALTPGWASWNMGIFLCMRCAALHRKLGTHISKIKSLSMDSWSSEQVDNMKSHGNILMNKIYNPRNIKPPIPTDIDEADACMERHIRAKYQYRSLENGKPKPPSREDSSYSNPRTKSPELSRRDYDDRSPEGSPPPLPPKSGKFFKFGLRSSSSTSNLRRFGNKPKVTSPTSDSGSWSPPPPLPSRRTTGLGAPVADVTTASFESKMAALQDMGFTNDRRNEMVLKGLNEDLDRAVETLVRLGEGSNPTSRSRTPAAASNGASARAVTPKPETSNNPFDRAVSNPVPQQSQPQTASYNPFDKPTLTAASAQPLESSFQNLQVSQPLFPHSTGGYPNQASSMQQPMYQQPYTPPVTATFSQSSYVASPQTMDSYNPFAQTAPQPQPQQPQNGLASQSYPNPSAQQTNPFFNTAQQNQPMQQQAQQMTKQVPTLAAPNQPHHANTMPTMSSSSPFGTSPFGPSPSFQGQQQQPQQQPNGLGSYNPFQSGPAPTTPQGAGGYPNQHQQPQQLMPQPTGQMDKNSILSLYNLGPSQSNIPPVPQQYQAQPQSTGMNPFPQPSNPYASMQQNQTNPQHQPQSQPQQQAANVQSSSANNPFFGGAPTATGLSAQAGLNPYQQQQQQQQPSPGAGSGLAAQAGINPYQQQQQQQQQQQKPTSGTGLAAQAGINPYQQQQQPGLGIGGMNNQPGGFGTTPTMGGNPSPFKSAPPAASAFNRTHMSQPSVDVSGLQNGRHSPDAFASLSARHG
ncbi:uncharacterized protein N7446_002153 [Penicillium canescens]|uniref:Arf-GAP domain-containing protein n=1 Tax=Penicillium canescens TaxID=5083 RepID=A0AAD6IDM6_PENCN|nr:uncharacterized protein N7446_002153 [Penicillium canescens]KAJ6043957.1 hypothetical protein N7460_005312 [Penicillium canescens]KAJ6055429.1 hypothetical protein N7444_004527 [Penicillium canescens]KAJ6074376.1 hypothetical protein N7446_002153 [Penicillium canescens]